MGSRTDHGLPGIGAELSKLAEERFGQPVPSRIDRPGRANRRRAGPRIRSGSTGMGRDP
jgi:hypothetical protein